ncbi:MAG TPA: tetratricopeptide repeat protein [Terriglobia bacterium]|nr:tetratricopeptide repeat protein [Terriglobia bacterium]
MTRKPENRFRDVRWQVGPALASLAALALLFAGDVLRAQQDLPARLQKVFMAGVQAQKAGELDAAEKAFLRVLREGGDVAFVYNNLGIVYQQRGVHAKAIEQFRKAIRLNPTYAAPRILLGASLLATGQVPEATRSLEKAVILQPGEPLARLQLAKAYERGNNFAGVVEQYRALREIAPQEPEYAYQLGNAYLRLAAWCYQEIARINPLSARGYQATAETYRMRGRNDIAIQAFQRAAAADPKLPEIHLALAEIYLEQGKPDVARREIEQELEIAPESAMALALKKKIEAAVAPNP